MKNLRDEVNISPLAQWYSGCKNLATFDWEQDTGTTTGSHAKGTTRTTGDSNANWKNSGVQSDVYSSYPIQAGNNSFQIVLFGKFTGTFDMILTGLFAHTAGAFGTGVTLKGIPNNTGDGDRYLYVTPSAVADSNLTVDMTSAISIGSGVTVCFGATGPEATGKATSSTNATTYSSYLATQLQTTVSANPGDTASIVLTFSYNEN